MAQQNSDRLVWLLAGAALGASIALLYAPQTGRDTRRLIGRKARQGREAIADVGQDLAEKGRDLYENGRRVADDAAEMLERGRRMMEG